MYDNIVYNATKDNLIQVKCILAFTNDLIHSIDFIIMNHNQKNTYHYNINFLFFCIVARLIL